MSVSVRGRPPLGAGAGGPGRDNDRSRSRGGGRPRPRSRSTSRVRTFSVVDGREQVEEVPIPGCICIRAYGVVYCRCCGWMLKGARVRTPCPVHPRTMYLLDVEQCAKCKSYPPLLTEFPADAM